MAKTKRRKSARKRRGGGDMLSILGWLALVGGLIVIAWSNGLFRLPVAALDPTSHAAFEQWIEESDGRAQEFAAFERYLGEQGVSDVVPVWQLARVDREYAERCDLDIWRLPPEELWPNIVPALKLVREYVIPTVGEVEVQSSYRSPELNACARGASRSRHIAFQALDLLAVERREDLGAFYRELCDMQERAGSESEMGLGAYYDASDPLYNPEGRFHIDGAGYRSWGRSYTWTTSICPRNR